MVPADGRSRAYIDGRPATAAALADAATDLVDLHGQHAHQRLLSPVSQRAALDAFGGDRSRPACARPGPGSPSSTPSWRRLAATSGRGRASSTSPASSSPSSTPRPSTIPTRRRRSKRSRTPWRAPSSIAAPGRSAYETLAGDGGARDAVASAAAASDAGERRTGPSSTGSPTCSPSSTTSARPSATRPSRSPTIRSGWRRCAPAASCCATLRRKYGDTLADVQRFHRDVAARVAEIERYDERAAAIDSERREAIAAVESRGRRRCSPPDGRRRRRFGAAVTARLAALAMPDADDRRDGRTARRRAVPAVGQPGNAARCR